MSKRMNDWSRIILLSTLCVLFGCGRPGDESEQDRNKSSTGSRSDNTDTAASVEEKATNTPMTLQEFALDPFGFKTTPENFVKVFGNKLTVTRRTVHNVHQPKILDTVFVLAAEKSRISIYRSAYNDILYEAVVRDSFLTFRHDIRVGMSKAKFVNAFTDLGDVSGDTLEVKDFEGTSKCIFIFGTDKLIRVEIDNYID